VLNDPIFATIKSINAWRAARGGSNPGRTPLDLSTFTDEEIALIIKQAKIAVLGSDTLEYPTIERKIFYIGILRNTELSDQELEDILDFELNPPDDQRFWPLKDEETINIFLADYVLEARKYERTSTLAPYLLK
jgi:hypothetical protein